MDKNISMVGVIHSDQRIESRLRRAVQLIQPDVIALEHGGSDVDDFINSGEFQDIYNAFRAKLKVLFSKFGISDSIENFLYGAEVDVCRSLSEEQGIPLVYMDHPRIVISLIWNFSSQSDSIYEMLEKQFMSGKKSTEESNADLQDKDYRVWIDHLNEQRYELDEYLMQFAQDGIEVGAFDEEREAYQEKQVRNAMDKYGSDKKIMTVGGIAHLGDFPEFRTLFVRLRNHVKSRFAAIEFDNVDQ